MQYIFVFINIAKFADYLWKMLMSAEAMGCVKEQNGYCTFLCYNKCFPFANRWNTKAKQEDKIVTSIKSINISDQTRQMLRNKAPRQRLDKSKSTTKEGWFWAIHKEKTQFSPSSLLGTFLVKSLSLPKSFNNCLKRHKSCRY